MSQYFVEGAEGIEGNTSQESDSGEKDTVDQVFIMMGGFGRVQKISYVMNTLAQGSAAFFLYCFVFLEKKPVFNCREVLTRAHDEEDVTDWQICKDHDYCAKPENLRRVNWTDPESIHNLVEQLDFYCEPDMMIGLIGALFLLGIVVGCSTLTRLGDVYGRKPIYLLGLFMHIFFMIGIIWSTNKFISYFLLFIFGMSVTARYYVGYTFNLEM